MTYAALNNNIYSAAFAGAMSQCVIRTGQSPTLSPPPVYTAYMAIADAWAQAVDIAWTALPSTDFENNAIQTESETYHTTHPVAPTDLTAASLPAYWTIPAVALVAAVKTSGRPTGPAITPIIINGTVTLEGTRKVATVLGPVIAASGTYTALDINGSGCVTHILMSLKCNDANGRNLTRLKIYIDNEGTPSIDVTMNDLVAGRNLEAFGGAGAITAFFESTYMGYQSFAFGNGIGTYIYLPIPFHTHIKIDYVNGSAANSTTLGGHIDYVLGTPNNWGNYFKLHGISLATLSVAYLAEQTLATIVGKGAYVGTYLYFDGGDGNYNYLEGPVKFYIDGEGVSSVAYDSTEDYFNHTWYCWVANATRNVTSSYVGVTMKNDADIMGMYRWHWPDPVYFTTGLTVKWTCGIAAFPVVANVNVNGVLWYYTDS